MIDAMPSLSLAAEKISAFEGFRAHPYLDSAGIPTIGFGSTHYEDGRRVAMTDAAVSNTRALEMLTHDLTETAANLWKRLAVQPTPNQWAALLSIAYNIGWPALASSTLLKLFNQGLPNNAATHFLDWSKAHVNGQLVTVPGLYNRRNLEMALFLTLES